MTTAQEQRALQELLAEYLDNSESLDYAELAESLAEELGPDEQRHFLIRGLQDSIRIYVAHLRPPTNGRGAGTSRRWDQVGEARDILNDWWVGFEERPSKPLLDCSPVDLLEAAEWYEKRALGYQARADAYSALARKLRRTKVSSPRELPREEVRRILNA